MTDTFSYLGITLLLPCSFMHLTRMGRSLLTLAGAGQTVEYSDQNTVLCPPGEEGLDLRREINMYS